MLPSRTTWSNTINPNIQCYVGLSEYKHVWGMDIPNERLSNDCQADRSRTVYTAQQVNALQATFDDDDDDMDPSMEKIEEVAKSIGQHVWSSMQRTN